MKKIMLLLTWAGSLLTGSTAVTQSVYYSESFSGGAFGWSERTTICQNETSPFTGTWTLTEVTQNGTPVDGFNANLTFNTTEEYTISFAFGEETRGFVQSKQFSSATQFFSTLPTDVPVLNGSDFSYFDPAARTLSWSAQLSISTEQWESWGRTLTLAADPEYQLTAGGLRVLDPAGAYEFFFEATHPCGRLWWWHPEGSVTPGASVADTSNLAIGSPTAGDGAMVINADFLTTGNSAPPAAPPYPFYQAGLISPRIDLSGATEKLSLKLHQLVRFANPSPTAPLDEYGKPLRTALAVSTDDGASWSAPIALNPFLNPAVGFAPAPPIDTSVLVPLPASVSGSDQVRLRFTWAADLFFWAIDDIEIRSRPTHDLTVKRKFAAITPNAVTPRSQLEPIPLLADIQNNGATTAQDVNLQFSAIADATGETVFSTDRPYGPLACDSLAENVLFDQMFDPAGLPKGRYEGRYLLTQDQPDEQPADNAFSWTFALSDTTFAKDLGPTTSLTATANPSFIYGNAYYIPEREDTTVWYARYMSFAVGNGPALNGSTVNTLLYRWAGDLNNDFLANAGEEYETPPLAINTYHFDGAEDTSLITLPVSGAGVAVPLEPGYHYLMLVSFESDNGQRIFPLFTTDYNYQGAWFATNQLEQTRYAGLLALGTDLLADFSVAGFGFDIVPVVRLHIGVNPDLSEPAIITSTEEAPPANGQLSFFPNPTQGRVRVRTTFPRLNIYEASSGRRVWTTHQKSGFVEEEINLSHLKAGVYILEAEGRQGKATEKLVIIE